MASLSKKYPFPSDIAVEDFVFVKLSLHNYSIWRPMMFNFIRDNGLIGFIDGTLSVPKPSITDMDDTAGTNLDYLEWKRSDALLRRWILKSLNDDVLKRVIHYKTARDLWNALECMLSQQFNKRRPTFSEESASGDNLSRYFELYHAIIEGDWETAERIFKVDPDSVRAIITGTSETALLVAARSAKRNYFLEKLLELLLPEDLLVQDFYGSTALHLSAAADNIEAAKWLVEKNTLLPGVCDKSLCLPLHEAAACGYREMVVYLLTVSRADMEPRLFEGESAVTLLHSLVAGGLYDISLSLLQQYPSLAMAEKSPLTEIAQRKSAFSSGNRFNFWQHLIYSLISVNLANRASYNGTEDIENPTDYKMSGLSKFAYLPKYELFCLRAERKGWGAFFWKTASTLVPQIKHIWEKKLINHQALQLVQFLCMEITKMDPEKAIPILETALFTAVTVGSREFVEEIVTYFPDALYFKNEMNQNIFQAAIVSRREDIFNLIYQFEGLHHMRLIESDASMNSALHLAGYMDYEHTFGSPKTPQNLYLRSNAAGAALQMQREIQWFKEVDELSLPYTKELRNTSGKTASMIFTETHEELAKEGEHWMKDSANSCTIVAALISTIMFAAAITIPGGNNDTGFPIFSKQPEIVVFAVSDALALFTSTSSMLMFLSILTSRYALEDFLYTLPNRLIIGLITLFLSMLFMMAAFSAALYLVFGKERMWVLVLVSAMAGTPVILFASLQYRSLLDMMKSTYGRGIFLKQSDRIIY